MNTMEVLTLLLVIFTALSFLDNHYNKKEIASHALSEDANSFLLKQFY